MGWFSKLFGGAAADPPQGTRGLQELARRVGIAAEELGAVVPAYREVRLPKRSGGERVLHVPSEGLKAVQRKLLRRVLGRLDPHEAVHGFRKGRSIVSNGKPHVGKAVVLRMDIRDFFPTTTAERILAYFLGIGWDGAAAGLLARLTTHQGGLPQGAPTSPHLSNLVNVPLDARLQATSLRFGAT